MAQPRYRSPRGGRDRQTGLAGLTNMGGATGSTRAMMGPMIGPALMIFVLLIGIPVGVMVSGAAAAAALGYLLKDDVDRSHEGSELLETNV